MDMREGSYIVIRKEFGVSYHPAHVSRVVRALGLSLHKPMPRANQRDEAAVVVRTYAPVGQRPVLHEQLSLAITSR